MDDNGNLYSVGLHDMLQAYYRGYTTMRNPPILSLPQHAEPQRSIIRIYQLNSDLSSIDYLSSSLLNPYAAGGQFVQYKMVQKPWNMTETLTYGYSSESTQRELSNEYQQDSVSMFFKNLFVLVIWTNVGLALEWLRS